MEGSVAIMKNDKFDLKGSDSIVRYVIDQYCEGHPNELARRLTFSGRNIVVTRQQVDGWINRKQFPREWIVTVHNLFKVPLKPLIEDPNG